MSTDRLAFIRSLLRRTGDDAFLLTAREDIRWACNFSGSSGALLTTRDAATLFTDGRYTDQARQEVRGADIEICQGDLIEAVGRHGSSTGLGVIGIDETNTSVAALRRLQSWPGEPEIRPYESPLAERIAKKDDEELAKMKRAQEISDIVFDEILAVIKPGVTECEVAAEIVYRHLLHGAESMSFDPIVASGQNGALPHARPTSRRLAPGDLVVMDFGCFFEGYASDMTRTIGIGMPNDDAIHAYEVVKEAQRAAQNAARSGIRACDVDSIARQIIDDRGVEGAFTHSLGHGLGLRIHEAPRIAATNDAFLPEGAVVTIEPGVYIPGQFGVRIENAVVLHPTGCDPLPRSSTELILL